jgi:hypothetical protein
LTRLNLIGCFEGELEDEEDEDESEISAGIRELRKFENLSHLYIDPVHGGVESLLDDCTFSLEMLHVTILLRSSNFEQILTPRPSLRKLRFLELMIFRWYGIEGCAPTAAFLESIILQVVQISTLENVLLQMPFHPSWAHHFKSLERLTVMEWRVGYFWFEQPLELDQLEGAFDELRAAGIEMFRSAFANVEFKVPPKIIIRAEKRYNWEGYQMYR